MTRADANDEQPHSDPPRGGFSAHHHPAVAVILAVLLAAGVWGLIGQAASYPKLVRAVEHLTPGWLAASVAGAIVGYGGYALLYQVFAGAAGGPRPPLGLTLRLTIAVFGASVIATSAGRLGSEYWSLRKMSERPSRAWSRVLGMNAAAWGILSALAVLGALALLGGTGRGAPIGLELLWLLVPLLCALLAAYLSSPARRHLTEERGGRVRRALAAALGGVVLIRCAASHPPDLARGLAGGLLYWGGELLALWAALRAFGVHLGYGPLAVGYATGYVSTMLPLPAGGAGGVDAAGTYALTLVGVPLGAALLAMLVQRLCTYWLPLAVAGASARSMKRLPGDLAAVPRPVSVSP